MLAAIKQFFSKHLSALNDEATALNERQAIYSGIKGFLLGVFRFTIILGVCYVIMGPVFGIIANSFFSNRDAYNPMVYLIPQAPTLERYQMAIKILDYLPTMLRSLAYSFALMLLQILTCSMVGYGFARYKFPLKNLLFGCVVVMIVIPAHTIMLPLYMTFRTFDPLGIVSAGSYDLKYIQIVKKLYTVRAHSGCRCGNLIDCLALHGKCSQVRRHLYRRRLSSHDLIHDCLCLRIGQILFLCQF